MRPLVQKMVVSPVWFVGVAINAFNTARITISAELDPSIIAVRLCLIRYNLAFFFLRGKIEKVPRGIRGEKSSKDMASSRNLVSTIGALASPKV